LFNWKKQKQELKQQKVFLIKKIGNTVPQWIGVSSFAGVSLEQAYPETWREYILMHSCNATQNGNDITWIVNICQTKS